MTTKNNFITSLLIVFLLTVVIFNTASRADPVELLDSSNFPQGDYNSINDALDGVSGTGWLVRVYSETHGPIEYIPWSGITIRAHPPYNPKNPPFIVSDPESGSPAVNLAYNNTVEGFKVTSPGKGRAGLGFYTENNYDNTLTYNRITGNERGIWFNYGDESLVNSNDITDNDRGVGVDYSWNNYYVGNNFHNNKIGFYQDENSAKYVHSEGHHLYFNSFEGNTGAAVKNKWTETLEDTGWVSGDNSRIDATMNWWGSSGGPTADFDKDGIIDYNGGGETVLGDVVVSPWLKNGVDNNSPVPGFQPSFPVTYIVAEVGPEPGAITENYLINQYEDQLPYSSPNPLGLPVESGYLNRAVFASNAVFGKDTIEVRAGNYRLTEKMKSPVILKGSNAGVNPILGTREPESIIDAQNTSGVALEVGGGPGEVIIDGFKITGFTGKSGGIIQEELGEDEDAALHVLNNIVTTEPGSKSLVKAGIQVSGENSTVISNLVSNATHEGPDQEGAGILFYEISELKAKRNLVKDSDVGVKIYNDKFVESFGSKLVKGNELVDNSTGIRIEGRVTNSQVKKNTLLNNKTGIEAKLGFDDVTVTRVLPDGSEDLQRADIHYNKFAGNGSYGLEVIITEEDWRVRPKLGLNASLNWWGSSTGPGGKGPGNGDKVSSHVIFSPWLGMDPDSDPDEPGVQLKSPLTFVVDDVGLPPNNGYLNQAIAASNDQPGRDTVRVNHGTYTSSSSQPVADGSKIVSKLGSPANTTINGELNFDASNVQLGKRKGYISRGFTVNADITVSSGVDASTVHINWNNLYGKVANKGNNKLDATYNWWGDTNPEDDTVGNVDYDPWLPEKVGKVLDYMKDNKLKDPKVAVIGMILEDAGPSEQAISRLTGMGFDISGARNLLDEYDLTKVINAMNKANSGSEFAELLGGYSLPAGAAGGLTNNIVSGGAGSVGGKTVGAVFTKGETIKVKFPLADFKGNPVKDLTPTVSFVLLNEEGEKEGLKKVTTANYKEDSSDYVTTVGAAGLEDGYYEVHIDLPNLSSLSQVIEVKGK